MRFLLLDEAAKAASATREKSRKGLKDGYSGFLWTVSKIIVPKEV
jgi:hypothetical protein